MIDANQTEVSQAELIRRRFSLEDAVESGEVSLTRQSLPMLAHSEQSPHKSRSQALLGIDTPYLPIWKRMQIESSDPSEGSSAATWLQNLTLQQLAQLSQIFRVQRIDSNDDVIKKNEKSSFFGVVLEGKLHCNDKTLLQGAIFGYEHACLNGHDFVRPYTIVGIGSVLVGILTYANFDSLQSTQPALHAFLTRQLARLLSSDCINHSKSSTIINGSVAQNHEYLFIKYPSLSKKTALLLNDSFDPNEKAAELQNSIVSLSEELRVQRKLVHQQAIRDTEAAVFFDSELNKAKNMLKDKEQDWQAKEDKYKAALQTFQDRILNLESEVRSETAKRVDVENQFLKLNKEHEALANFEKKKIDENEARIQQAKHLMHDEREARFQAERQVRSLQVQLENAYIENKRVEFQLEDLKQQHNAMALWKDRAIEIQAAHETERKLFKERVHEFAIQAEKKNDIIRRYRLLTKYLSVSIFMKSFKLRKLVVDMHVTVSGIFFSILEHSMQSSATDSIVGSKANSLKMKRHRHAYLETLTKSNASPMELLSSLDDEIQNLKQPFSEVSKQLNENKQKVGLFFKRNIELAAQIVDLTTQLKSIESQAAAVMQQNSDYRLKIENADAENQHLQEQVVKLQAKQVQLQETFKTREYELSNCDAKKEAERLQLHSDLLRTHIYELQSYYQQLSAGVSLYANRAGDQLEKTSVQLPITMPCVPSVSPAFMQQPLRWNQTHYRMEKRQHQNLKAVTLPAIHSVVK